MLAITNINRLTVVAFHNMHTGDRAGLSHIDVQSTMFEQLSLESFCYSNKLLNDKCHLNK